MHTALVVGYLATGLPVGIYLAAAVFVLSGTSLWGDGTGRKMLLAFIVGTLFYPLVLLWMGVEKVYRSYRGV